MIERYYDVPYQPITPFLEPLVGPEWVEFAYPTKMREWWKAVGGNKCQTHFYDEKRGWHICGSTKDIEVDHIEPESTQLAEGHDPNNSVGIPRCRECHTGMGLIREDDGSVRLAIYSERGWSKHPDMGAALQAYREGDKDAFKKAAGNHKRMAALGIPIANSSPEVDQFEMDYMLNLERKYIQESGRRRPSVKPHRKRIPRL